jgi:tetrahydromethanopterin S-methyltransferase subunit G
MSRKKRFKQLERDIEAIFLFIVVGVLIFVLLAALIVERWFR